MDGPDAPHDRSSACLVLPLSAHADVSRETFLLRTTGDLLALCSVRGDDPNAVAAIHFCHGYVLGLRHYAEATGQVFRGALFCPPVGAGLTRDESVRSFVSWAAGHAQYMSEPPFDGIALGHDDLAMPALSDAAPGGVTEMRIAGPALLLILLGVSSACADMNSEQKRMATGTAIGAGGGLLIGAIAGDAAAGAAIGAGVGLLGGVLANQHEKAKADSYNAGYQAGQQGAKP